MGIERKAVEAAQAAWGAAVVYIGESADHAEAVSRAGEVFDTLYIGDGSLLFCPTLAADEQFRPTRRDAVSYFVGGDDKHPEDNGFALAPYTAVRFENAGIVLRGDTAIAMGNYFFTRPDGSELKVEYTFAYVPDGDGLRIQVHHSALPYSPG